MPQTWLSFFHESVTDAEFAAPRWSQHSDSKQKKRMNWFKDTWWKHRFMTIESHSTSCAWHDNKGPGWECSHKFCERALDWEPKITFRKSVTILLAPAGSNCQVIPEQTGSNTRTHVRNEPVISLHTQVNLSFSSWQLQQISDLLWSFITYRADKISILAGRMFEVTSSQRSDRTISPSGTVQHHHGNRTLSCGDGGTCSSFSL